jgi:ABC-2 type transport system permease protein
MLLLAVVVFGFRPGGGVLGALACLGVAVLVGWAFGWVFMALASWARDAELMQAAGTTLMFVLMFASSAYVPLDSLSGWLRAVAEVNLLNHAMALARSAALDVPVDLGPPWALPVSVAIIGGAVALALLGLRRRPGR